MPLKVIFSLPKYFKEIEIKDPEEGLFSPNSETICIYLTLILLHL